jgi:hypothetical protein
MTPDNQTDLIELGTASVETKGAPFGMDDTQAGRYQWPGLSEE